MQNQIRQIHGAPFYRLARAWVMAAGTLFLAAISPGAAMHIIQFGGSHGFTYSPNQLSVAVGDTVTWEGDFTMHPLSSTSVPAGAAAFSAGAGTAFSYRVAAAGTYQYRCNYHYASGMTGSFTAGTSIEETPDQVPPGNLYLGAAYPNPANRENVVIPFFLPAPQAITVAVYGMDGRKITVLRQGPAPAGSYQALVPAGRLGSGVYIARLEGKNITRTKKFTIGK